MRVGTDRGTWTVPPGRGLWIPAGVTARIEMSGTVELRCVFLERGLATNGMGDGVRGLGIAPLLRELIIEVCRRSVLWHDLGPDVRLADILVDQLVAAPAAAWIVPRLRDPRAQRAAAALEEVVAAGSMDHAITQAANAAGASRRTLERLFLRDTNMTLGAWLTRLRLSRALELLASGASVTDTALEVGYATASSFINAFRRIFGTTPHRYRAGPTKNPAATSGLTRV